MTSERPHYFYSERVHAGCPHHFDYAWGLTSELYYDIYAWCRENCKRDWHYLAGAFHLSDDDDAFNFRMRWC